MADESLLTVIVGALVLLAGVAGLVSYSGLGPDIGSGLGGVEMPTGNMLASFFHQNKDSETVKFSATLMSSDYQDLIFDLGYPVDKVSMEYSAPNPEVDVNGLLLDPFNMSLSLHEFRGDVYISEKASVIGSASRLAVKDTSINSQDKVPVDAANISVDMISIDGLDDESFLLKNVYGVINITSMNGKLTYDLDSENDLEIRSFKGSFMIDEGVMRIEGSGILKADVIISSEMIENRE